MEGNVGLCELPDDILLDIFCCLEIEDLACVAAVCKAWNRVAQDNILWREFFHRDWKIREKFEISEGRTSWKSEYKRLKYHTPAKQSQLIGDNKDEVFHVSFSNDGSRFVTGCKDGTLQIWSSSHPCELLFQYQLESQMIYCCRFNSTDSLLLACGEDNYSSSVTVFSFKDGIQLLQSEPSEFGVFSGWYDDKHMLTTQYDPSEDICKISVTAVKETQQTDPPLPDQTRLLFKFPFESGTYFENFLVANCYTDEQLELKKQNKLLICESRKQIANSDLEEKNGSMLMQNLHLHAKDFNFSAGTLKESGSGQNKQDGGNVSQADGETKQFSEVDQGKLKAEPLTFQVTNKLFVFVSCGNCAIPHQINIKRFQTDLKTLPETDDHPNDTVDYTFDMHGHPVGLCLSPDHRYLFVNCRPFPKDYVIEDFYDEPPLLNIIELHTIDLQKMIKLDHILKSHSIISPFFVYMDANEDYVASGSEDRFGYVWDRHYRICLNKFPHDNGVNCVAFNPADSEMLVTVSDDYHIKVWRSHNWFHQQQQLQEKQQRRQKQLLRQKQQRKRPK